MKAVKLFFLSARLHQGGERVITDLSFAMPEYVEVTYVVYEPLVSYPVKGKVMDLGIPLSLNPFLRMWRLITRFLKFREILKREKPDYVVSMGRSANMMNIFANPKAIVRVDMHPTKGTRGVWGLLYRVFIRLFFRKAALIICVSKAAAQDLIEQYHVPKEKIKVIYNPLDLKRIQTLMEESIPSSYEELFRHPTIITVGRLTKQKGHLYLLNAFAKVKEHIPHVKLLILGEGELKKGIEQLTRDLGIERDVHLLGWQKNPYAFLRRSSVFVLSSLWEGLPTVLLEAMACGLPVVSFDCESGPREILAPSTDIQYVAKNIEKAEYGVLVPPAQSNLLGSALIEILRKKELAASLGKIARQRADMFDIHNVIRQWDFLF